MFQSLHFNFRVLSSVHLPLLTEISRSEKDGLNSHIYFETIGVATHLRGMRLTLSRQKDNLMLREKLKL